MECPTGSGVLMNLQEVADERFQTDPAWSDPLFYECFDGDTGRGLGASHQTGWTGLVADLIIGRRG